MKGAAAPAAPGPGVGDRVGAGREALVVFGGDVSLWWLRVLRPGFRHCLVAVRDGDHWLVCDPLSHQTVLAIGGGASAEDLSAWYHDQGMTVVATAIRCAPRRAVLLRPLTCVEAVKKVLGIHESRIITPWNLYKFLKNTEKEKNSLTSDAD